MEFTTLPESEQLAFAVVYNAVALENARRLLARGIDGEAMFKSAQAWIHRMGGSELPLTAAGCPVI
jgi:hypothetical protein